MSHKFRVGPIESAYIPVVLSSSVPAYAIEIGDLIGRSSTGFAVLAANTTWDTDTATTQAAFKALWAGVANQRSRLASTDARDLTIEVYTNGSFDVDLATAASLVVGDYLAPAKASGNALLNTLVKTAVKASALFVVTESDGTSKVTWRVKLIDSNLNF